MRRMSLKRLVKVKPFTLQVVESSCCSVPRRSQAVSASYPSRRQSSLDTSQRDASLSVPFLTHRRATIYRLNGIRTLVHGRSTSPGVSCPFTQAECRAAPKRGREAAGQGPRRSTPAQGYAVGEPLEASAARGNPAPALWVRGAESGASFFGYFLVDTRKYLVVRGRNPSSTLSP